MNWYRLTFLLFLYVSADFANPLMPGAVSYANGSIEAVQVERSRMEDVPPVAPVVAFFDRIDLANLKWRAPQVTLTHPIRTQRRVPPRRVLPARSDSSSSEDH
jgi:hypothetical protein